jgi:hypothetical protein
VIEAQARGMRNTTKVEVPEIDAMTDPVMRLQRTGAGISYEAFDGAGPQGLQILQTLDEGLTTTPPTTMMTVTNRASATMARFI